MNQKCLTEQRPDAAYHLPLALAEPDSVRVDGKVEPARKLLQERLAAAQTEHVDQGSVGATAKGVKVEPETERGKPTF